MKIAWFKTAISPEIGCLISGYGWDFYSVTRSDDIYMTGLCCDDGNNKVLVISFDLLALDESFIRRIRKKGADILAAAGGKVIMAKYYGGYGNCIIVDHGGGMSTLYAHMSAYVAKEGDWVSAGQVIGKVGSTGNSTGPHLHFEVRINGSPVNPLSYAK